MARLGHAELKAHPAGVSPSIGASVHVCVPALYAWAVTVAQSAFARGGPWEAAATGIVAPLALLAGVLLGARWGARVRDACLAIFVLGCAATWCLAPATLGPRHVDWMRGAAGVLGWGLFGLAWAGPPLPPPEARTGVERGDPGLMPRRRLPRGDAVYLAFAAITAGSLQLVGWDVVPPERALLVRCVALACGLGILGSVAEVAASRLGAPAPRRGRIGFRRGLMWIIAVALLSVLGAQFWREH
jgi:hypothetical protein